MVTVAIRVNSFAIAVVVAHANAGNRKYPKRNHPNQYADEIERHPNLIPFFPLSDFFEAHFSQNLHIDIIHFDASVSQNDLSDLNVFDRPFVLLFENG